MGIFMAEVLKNKVYKTGPSHEAFHIHFMYNRSRRGK